MILFYGQGYGAHQFYSVLYRHVKTIPHVSDIDGFRVFARTASLVVVYLNVSEDFDICHICKGRQLPFVVLSHDPELCENVRNISMGRLIDILASAGG